MARQLLGKKSRTRGSISGDSAHSAYPSSVQKFGSHRRFDAMRASAVKIGRSVEARDCGRTSIASSWWPDFARDVLSDPFKFGSVIKHIGPFPSSDDAPAATWTPACGLTKAFPLSNVGLVIRGNASASGCLIGPRHVLTASHNIPWVNEQSYDFESSIKFIPGVCPKNWMKSATGKEYCNIPPVGATHVLAYLKIEGPQFSNTRAFDYAVLILERDVLSSDGYFSVWGFEPEDSLTTDFQSAGYPVYRDAAHKDMMFLNSQREMFHQDNIEMGINAYVLHPSFQELALDLRDLFCAGPGCPVIGTDGFSYLDDVAYNFIREEGLLGKVLLGMDLFTSADSTWGSSGSPVYHSYGSDMEVVGLHAGLYHGKGGSVPYNLLSGGPAMVQLVIRALSEFP